MNEIRLPYDYIPSPTVGNPIASGYIYIGTAGTDPTVVLNQISVSARQEDGTEVALSQPIRTNAGGNPVLAGSPVTLLIAESTFSITVLNSLAAQVYTQSNATSVAQSGSTVSYSATVALMKAGSPAAGITIETGGYYDGWAAFLEPQGAGRYNTAALADIRTAKGDGAWVPDELIDHTCANGVVAMLDTGSELNLLQAGYKADNSTDNTLNIQAAVTYAPEVLFVPEGTGLAYGSNILNLLNPIKIKGAGMGRSIIKSTFSTPGEAFTAIKINSSDIVLEDFTFNAVGDTTSAVAMNFPVTADNIRINRFELTGNGSFNGLDTNLIQGIKVGDTADVTDVKVTDSKINFFHFGLFTANTFTGECSDWTFKGNRFANNTADDLEFNSSNNPLQTWTNIQVIGNTFIDSPSSTGNSFGVGTDSGQEITVLGNHFYNYVGAAVHLEDYLVNVLVNSNQFHNCAIGIECYNDNNSLVVIAGNTLDGALGRSITDDPSAFASPNATLLNNKIGIIAQRPSAGTNRGCQVYGNTISDYDVGISAPDGMDNQIYGNNVSLCGVAYNFQESGEYNFYNNTASLCKFAAWGGANSTLIQSLVVDRCPTLLYTASPSFVIREKLIVTVLAEALASGLTTSVPLCEMPSKIWGGQVSLSAVRVENDAIVTIGVGDLTYDGSTLSAARNMTFFAGGVSTANPQFANSGTTLDARIFHSIGTPQDFKVTMTAQSTFAFN